MLWLAEDETESLRAGGVDLEGIPQSLSTLTFPVSRIPCDLASELALFQNSDTLNSPRESRAQCPES